MKKKRWKSVFAGALTAAMVCNMGLASMAWAEPEEDAGTSLLADFSFDDENDALAGGNAKASGNYTLTDSYDGGKALHLDGSSSQYLTVTGSDGSSLLTGVEEMTVSYDIKNERTGTNWAVYAAPTAGTQTYGKEKYIGFLHKSGNLTVERYNNTGSRPANPSAAVGSEWVHVDAVLSKTDTTIYVNGVKESSAESSYTLPELLGDSSILQIGKANWGNGEYAQASIDNLKIYGKALTQTEVENEVPETFITNAIASVKEKIRDVVLSDSQEVLPDYNGMVTWKSSMPEVVIAEDGLTATVKQPAVGEEAVKGTLTAVITLAGKSEEVEVPVTVKAVIGENDEYGYLMVHFVEDSKGYAEKMYLDISRGDNPEQWDPLNGRNPILTSNLGTTGSRDPFLTYNPETKTYYIIATDLRVFGADNAGWTAWTTNYSTKMNVWESKDLITWSDVRQFDVNLNTKGEKQDNLGMMWAPEATWVDDYYGEGKGAFVVYWTSQCYTDEAQTTRDGGQDIMWGATTDFTQETWEYGGKFLEGGSAGWIDTDIIQDGDKTYHITKSNSEQIIMEVTTAKDWWNYDTTKWTRVQSHIGQSRFGSVEGPAAFKDHSQENRWYLFVDDLPTPGYQPMVSTNLDEGWDYLDASDYFLTSYTKHGGVISLTKGQYDALRAADATSVVNENLGTVEISKGSSEEALAGALPQNAEVNLAYDMGTSSLPVVWDTKSADLNQAGTYEVTGTVQSISSNKDAWTGKDGSTNYLAEDKKLYSSRAIKVKATVNVQGTPDKLAIVTDPSDYKGIVGETAEFTVEATGKDLTYQWEYCNAGSSKWRTSSMEGSDTATIKVPMGTWRDGQKYRCVVKDAAGNTVTSKAAVMTVGKADTAPVITTQPESVTKNKGEIAEFTVKTTGEGLTYQWEYCNAGSDKWRTSSMEGNQTETIKVAAGSWRDGQKYRCVVTGTDGRIVVSETAVLTVK